MTNRLQLLRYSAFIFVFTSVFFRLSGQVFTGTPVYYTAPEIDLTFTAYEVFRMETQPLVNQVKSNAESNTTLLLGSHQFNLNLVSSNLVSENYFLQLGTPEGNKYIQRRPDIFYKGYESSGGKVRLTIDNQFLYGFIEQDGLKWYVEPLWYIIPDADKDLFLIYEKSDVVPQPHVKCGVTEEMEKAAMLEHHAEEAEAANADMLGTYELEMALAADKLMLDKYGSDAGVEAHIMGILNMVEGDYTGSFNHDLCIEVVTVFVAQTFPGPWTASNDAGTVLGSFTNWGNAGNFGSSFDVAEMWTDRDFSGGTVGIAWLNGICNSNKYHCIQDWTDDLDYLRCTCSHELGHNFSANHDVCSSGTFIMCPFVSHATAWSAQSQTAINGYMQTRINNGCLSQCSPNPPLIAGFDWEPEPGCVGQPVQFTDQSTGIINSWLWTFAGGTPATSTQQHPTATFSTPGPHQVSLLISGVGGTNALSQIITIDPLAVADFSVDMDVLEATFTNLSQNADTYLWEFGDGHESSDSDPVHTYDEAGEYLVTLHATNHCGTVTYSMVVNTFPAAAFSAEPTTGCASLLVEMMNESSSNATSFQWSMPGAIPALSNQANPIVLYTSPGFYTVTLTAYNTSGSTTMTRTNYIHVITVPAPGFTFTTNGLTVNFNNTSVNGTSFLWNFGDNSTSTQTNPVHTYATGGTYTVTLSAINACGTVVLTKTVSLEPPPVAAFSTTGNTGCGPLTVGFTNNSTGATSYNWTFPGGTPATSSDTNPTVTYANPGVYTATLTAINGSGSSTATSTITVNTVPGAAFSSMVTGSTAAFTNTTTSGNSYSWDFGDGGSSTEENPTYDYGADGTYTVTLIATNDCGNDTTTQTLTIVTPPSANFSAGPTVGCASLTVQYTNTSSNNATAFSWSFPGGDPATSTAQNPTVVYNTAGVYSATLIAQNSAGNDTITYTNIITVNTTANAGFTSSNAGAVVTFTNTSTNATSYSWNFGDGNTSTETNPVHTYATDGVYTVVLSATNACGTVTSSQTVTVVTPPVANFNGTPVSGCVPLTVQFTNTSSNNSVTYEWQFPGGTPSSSTDQNPTVTYNTPGLFTVTLTATNAAGSNSITLTDYVSVGTTPVAGFNATVNQSTATFNNTSTNGQTYSWDFGDGGSSNEVNPSHTYAADGTYTVVLSATNACGTSTSTQTVVVITEPDAGFTASNTSGCGPLTISFVNLSSENSTSWEWTFEGGTPSTSTDENPVITFGAPGNYDVTLVATGPGGSNSFTQQNFITVLPLPTPGFTFNQSQNTIAFTNTSTDATSYLWDFGDGNNSVEQNPTHTYTADGTYTVTLTATNACGSFTTTQTLTVVTPPIAAFTFNSASGCAPFTAFFNNTSSENATSFEWTFESGDPAVSNLPNPSCTWNTPGVYTVVLTASNSAGNSTATATITVGGVPAPGFTSQTAGLTVVFNNTTQNGTTYAWSFGDGGLSNEVNPSHTYASAGTYTVTMVATNDCGTASFTQTITIVGSAPIPSFSSNLTNGCAGMTVQFTDQSVGDPTAWNWTFEGGNPGSSTDQNPSVTYAIPGVYDVTLEVTNIYGSSTVTLPGYITISGLPVPGFNYASNAGTVDFTNASQGGTSYLWEFGDGSTSTEENPTHTYANSGVYTVSLTVTNACGASTFQQSVMVTLVGIDESTWLESFKLFPNPSAGKFVLEMKGEPKTDMQLILYNSLGQLMYSEMLDFSSGTLNKTLDLNHLPSAVYTMQLKAGTATKYTKVVIQK
ncbi:MAG: PKD domain-containing protein [Saprospiraceae bacterium]|nr:PKD domain-containing protein [Saprospiraceae bacterium]